MIRRQWAGVWVLAVWALVAAAGPASAQVNTGTVLGTVKDPQGGVIPGVTVVLVSEAQGTRSAPVVTNATMSVTAGKNRIDASLRYASPVKRSPRTHRTRAGRADNPTPVPRPCNFARGHGVRAVHALVAVGDRPAGQRVALSAKASAKRE